MSKHSKSKENGTEKEMENKIGQENEEREKAESVKGMPAGKSEDEAKPDDAISQKEKEREANANKIKELEAQIKTLSEENVSLKDQYLRKTADYENFRKRMFREKDEAILYANQNLLVDMVSVIDDFDRAIESSEKTKDFSTLYQGIDLTRKKFLGLLESKYALKRFESKGMPFDHHAHEAVMVEYRDDLSEPVVVEEFMKGYQLNDRVIRSTKVKVAMPKPDMTPNANSPVKKEEPSKATD